MKETVLELRGHIKVIDETQTFDSGFTKREFVITTGGEYPQDVKFEVVKDKCSVLDLFSTGQEVKVMFNVRGNEYNGKHYVNLAAWRIDSLGQASNEVATTATPAQAATPAASNDDLVADEIPF